IITAKKDLLAAQVTGKISFDGQRVDQSIVLQPCMKISGTIVFFDGSGLPSGVNPVVQLRGPGGINLLIDAPSGVFSVKGLPVAFYTLTTDFSYLQKPFRGIVVVQGQSGDNTT